jgi:surface antigen
MVFGRIGLVIGTVLLAGIGHALADGLDDTDRSQRRQALIQVLAEPVGSSEDWSNIDSGRHGSLTVTAEAPGKDGGTCRQVAETRREGPNEASGVLTVCRSGGSWQVIRSNMSVMAPIPADLPPDSSQANGLGQLPPIQLWVNGNRSSGGTPNTTTAPKAGAGQ